MNGLRVRRITAAGLAVLALALPGRLVSGQGTSSAISPTTTIKLLDGTSLASFDTWLVDHHDADPEKVFTVVDQIDGAPAIRFSGKVWALLQVPAHGIERRLEVSAVVDLQYSALAGDAAMIRTGRIRRLLMERSSATIRAARGSDAVCQANGRNDPLVASIRSPQASQTCRRRFPFSRHGSVVNGRGAWL